MKSLLKLIFFLNCFQISNSQPWQSTSSPINGISTLVHQGNSLAPNFGRQGNTGFNILENTMHPDGGRIIVSTTLDQNGLVTQQNYSNSRIRVQSTRPNSTIIFDKVYGFDLNSDLTPTGFDYNILENGYAISGVNTKMDGVQKKSVFFMKIDYNGNKKASFIYNINPPENHPTYTNQVALEMVSRKTGLSTLTSTDGCYYIVGYSTPDLYDNHTSDKIPFLISLNKEGQMLWIKHSIRNSHAELYNSIKEIPNSGIVVGGTSYNDYDNNLVPETVFSVSKWDYNGNLIKSVQYEDQLNVHNNQLAPRFIADMLFYPQLQKLYVLSWKLFEEIPELAEIDINTLNVLRYKKYEPQFNPSMSASLCIINDLHIGISGYSYANGIDMDKFIMPINVNSLSAVYFKEFIGSQNANSELVYTPINKYQQHIFNGGAHISGPFIPNVSFLKSYDNGNNLELSFVAPRLNAVLGLPGTSSNSIVTDIFEYYLPGFSIGQGNTCFSDYISDVPVTETTYDIFITFDEVLHSLQPFTNSCIESIFISNQNDNLNTDCYMNSSLINDIYFTTNIIKHPTSSIPLGGEIEIDASTLNGIVQIGLTYTISPPSGVLVGNKFTQLGPGTYTISLFNGGVYKGSKTVILNLNTPNIYDPCLPQPMMTLSLTQPTCGTAGSVSISSNSGVAPYSYSLTRNGLTRILKNSNGIFNNLGPGVYTITVIDAQGQSSQQQFTINAPNYSTTNLASNDNLNFARGINITNTTNQINVNWNDYNHAVNHQLFSADLFNNRNATIEVGEPQPFSNEFGQNLVHSVWFKFYVPNIPSRIRLFSQLGTVANARTAIAVYKNQGNSCSPGFGNLIEVAKHFEGTPPNILSSFYPNLPIAQLVNGQTINNTNVPGFVNPCTGSLSNNPERSYIEFEANADQIYYVQVFMVNPNYDKNTFIDANVNQNNQCFIDDKLYISVDLEPHSNIHLYTNPNPTNYSIEMNRAGATQQNDPAAYKIYTRQTQIIPTNYCNSYGPSGPHLFTIGTNTVISGTLTNRFYFGAYIFNSSLCGLSASTALTRVHDSNNPAGLGQSLKTDGTSTIESINPTSHGISISPNPASVELNISINESSLDVKSLEVININGQVVSNIDLDHDVKNLKLNIAEFVNGSYIIHFRDQDRTVVKSFKFIKD